MWDTIRIMIARPIPSQEINFSLEFRPEPGFSVTLRFKSWANIMITRRLPARSLSERTLEAVLINKLGIC